MIMKKRRIWSGLLALAMVLCLLPSAPARAAEYVETLKGSALVDGQLVFVIHQDETLWGYTMGEDGPMLSACLMKDAAQIDRGSGYYTVRKTDGTLVAFALSDNWGELRVMGSQQIATDVKEVSSPYYLTTGGELWKILGGARYEWEPTAEGKAIAVIFDLSTELIAYDRSIPAPDHVPYLTVSNDGVVHEHNIRNGTRETIGGLPEIEKVYSFGSSNFAIDTEGTLWSWGQNNFGQLGNGGLYDSAELSGLQVGGSDVDGWYYCGLYCGTPTAILQNVEEMFHLGPAICARDSSGVVWQWADGDGARMNTYPSTKYPGQLVAGGKVRMPDLKSFTPRIEASSQDLVYACGDIVYRDDGTVRSGGGVAFTLDGSVEACGFIQVKDGSGWMVKPMSGYTYVCNRGALASEPSPVDIPSTWAAGQVNTAISAGIVPEALQSKYTAATTRAEFCALAVALYETATDKEITGRSTFSDTTDVNVQKMASLGVVAGVGDNKFSPNTSLTREQAAAMLSRLASVMNKPMPEQAPTFADNGSIGSWAYDAVGHVQAAGIMSGVGNNQFSPSTAYTREQSIVTMLRMFDYVK